MWKQVLFKAVIVSMEMTKPVLPPGGTLDGLEQTFSCDCSPGSLTGVETTSLLEAVPCNPEASEQGAPHPQGTPIPQVQSLGLEVMAAVRTHASSWAGSFCRGR